MNFRIRPALTGSELSACHMLLGEISRNPTLRFFVAEADVSPWYVGAVMYRRVGSRLDGLQIHVVPDARGRGVGSALLDAVLQVAHSLHCEVCTTWLQKPELEGGGFLARNGFTRTQYLSRTEGSAQHTAEYFARLLQQLDESGRTPAGATRAELDESTAHLVAPVYGKIMLGRENPRTDVIRARLLGGEYVGSPVLRINREMVGFGLRRVEGELFTFDALAVVPGYRGQWPIVAVIAWTTADGVAKGATRIRFEWFDDVVFTGNLPRRLGFPTEIVGERWTRQLD